jgi:hypothetical protein
MSVGVGIAVAAFRRRVGIAVAAWRHRGGGVPPARRPHALAIPFACSSRCAQILT